MQESIAVIIVVYAFCLVAKRYVPQSVQRFARIHMARAARRLGWMGIASKFETEKPPAPSCSDGCGSCGRCGSSEAEPAIKSFSISPGSIKRSSSRF
ncbi:DUF6587 family protein [Polaromonas sp. UBA4122]|uniref:DUF6587 family protein n=1 Tax=Polaromonas sp. UBA4122 TaxID=1947074 RepID=UPI0025D5DA2A|nr:DUF6587 family protein [Polaromonas sp. UBA4122]